MGDTYFRKVTYHLHCRDQQALAERLRQLAHQARAQQACICFDVLREQQSPEHWVIYEGWRSQESCDAFHDSAAARELHRNMIEQQVTDAPQNVELRSITTPEPRQRDRSRRWQPYLWVCLAMCVGVMGTALASPLYPLYQARWNLSASHITQLYVAYMAAALLGLLFLGRLSDRKGFMPVLRTGLVLVTSGVALSAFAWDVYSFLVSRILIGLASSMIVTSASIGLTQLNRGGDMQRAAATTSLMLAFGFGLGPVVGGLIAQWAPTPLFSSYLPSILLGVLAIYALFQITPPPSSLPQRKDKGGWRAWLPRIMMPAGPLKRPFLLGCLSACCAFAMFSLFASLAPSFMAQMVPWHGPATSGLSIGIILFLSSGFQLMVRRWPAKRSVLVGLSAFSLANLALLTNLWAASSLLFVLCVLVTSFGHGLCMVGGMSVVNKVSPPHQRAGMTSTYLVIAYLGAILPILGLGWLADHLGLDQGLMIFCGMMIVATIVVAIVVRLTPAIAAPARS